jgi:hypothetical protein
MAEESWKTYSNALRQLLQRPSFRSQFRQDIDGSTTAELNIPDDMAQTSKTLSFSFPLRRSPCKADKGIRGRGAAVEHGPNVVHARPELAEQEPRW